MVDHALLTALAYELVTLGDVVHAHAGNLAEKCRRVPVEEGVEGVSRGHSSGVVAARAARRSGCHPRKLGRGRDLEVPTCAGGVLHRHAHALLHLCEKRCRRVRAHERHAVVHTSHARPAGGAGSPHVELRAAVRRIGVCERPQAAPEERDLGGPATVRQVEQEEEVHATGGLQYVVYATHHVAAGHEHGLVHVGGHHALDEPLAVAAEVGMGQGVRIREGGNVRLGNAGCGAKSREKLGGRVLARVEDFPMFMLSRLHRQNSVMFLAQP